MSVVGTSLLILAAIMALFMLHQPTRRMSALHCFVLLTAMGALMYARVTDDLTLQHVVEHTGRGLPFLYQITGAWGNHEGSMLLWVCVLAIYGAALARGTTALERMALRLHASLGLLFLLFILLTSNPFAPAVVDAAPRGMLNPLLQDVGLALHPPMLYLGYVGFAAVFSLAVAALLTRADGRSFALIARPYMLAAWSALTLGIALGSWWAYRELGWGGWWFWDPVENASLLPWLAGTALLHANAVLRARGQLYAWVLLLAISTFAMSLLGTFLVRSGVLTSVHSFASDPARGLFILALMGGTIGGALMVYALRAPTASREPLSFFSREGGVVINNLFLVVACSTVLLGTLYPLLAEVLFGSTLTVGAPYYHKTVMVLLVLPCILLPLTPLVAWKRGTLKQISSALPALLAAAVPSLIVTAFALPHAALAGAGLGLAVWIFSGSVTLVLRHRRALTAPILAVALAHAGVGLMVAGVTAEGLWGKEVERVLHPADTLDLGRTTLHYAAERFERRGNHLAKIATIELRQTGRHVATLSPEYRVYPDAGVVTSEARTYTTLLGDVYVTIGASTADGGTAVRAYYKPLMSWVWSAFVMATLGGLLACFRRQR